ncbi:MAG TPA: peptidoglycan DD-metalloendopeptidase family protein [Vicinamibacterales bacterium]
MSRSSLSSIAVNAPRDLTPAADPVREREQVAQLAQEFEAMLMLQMIRQMRQSLLDESEQPDGLGGSTMQDTFDVEFARHLAQAGGFGLGAMLTQQLAARNRTEVVPDASATPVAAHTASPSLSDVRHAVTGNSRAADTGEVEQLLTLPLSSAMTSPFGWRSDPFTGRSRFHTGVDLRAAYGTDVPCAADGEVIFAGERGGYGNLVIVRHAGGLETRYAHLASIDVAAGTRVAEGQSVGRVGSTGRSTAPHLHFEVLVNGERVDPAMMAGRIGRGPLKSGDRADD